MATRSSRRVATARRKRRRLRQSPRVGRLATKDAPGRLAADTACGSAATCEASCRRCGRTAAAFLSDVEARPDSPEAGVAHRTAGITCWFAGEYREARDHSNVRWPCSNPAATMIWLFALAWTPASPRWSIWRIASWPLGEVDRAISLIDQRCSARMAELTHVGTFAPLQECTRQCSN